MQLITFKYLTHSEAPTYKLCYGKDENLRERQFFYYFGFEYV